MDGHPAASRQSSGQAVTITGSDRGNDRGPLGAELVAVTNEGLRRYRHHLKHRGGQGGHNVQWLCRVPQRVDAVQRAAHTGMVEMQILIGKHACRCGHTAAGGRQLRRPVFEQAALLHTGWVQRRVEPAELRDPVGDAQAV